MTNEFDCAAKAVVFHTILWYGIVFGDCSSRTDVVQIGHGALVYIRAVCLGKERPGRITHNRKSPINSLQVSPDNAQYGSQ